MMDSQLPSGRALAQSARSIVASVILLFFLESCGSRRLMVQLATDGPMREPRVEQMMRAMLRGLLPPAAGGVLAVAAA